MSGPDHFIANVGYNPTRVLLAGQFQRFLSPDHHTVAEFLVMKICLGSHWLPVVKSSHLSGLLDYLIHFLQPALDFLGLSVPGTFPISVCRSFLRCTSQRAHLATERYADLCILAHYAS